MTVDLRHWGRLLELRESLGPIYGSEDLCVLLYSLARREKPRSIVEIGTGMGVCTCWVAHALRENGFGQILTLDDARDFSSKKSVRLAVQKFMRRLDIRWERGQELTYTKFLRQLASLLELSGQITFVPVTIRNTDDILRLLPTRKVDWVFSDFAHGPETILAILNTVLPKVRTPASIFFDSASTYWPSYKMLQALVREVNTGSRGSGMLDATATKSLAQCRVSLMHLTESKRRKQNSTAWLRIEPANWKPFCREE